MIDFRAADAGAIRAAGTGRMIGGRARRPSGLVDSRMVYRRPMRIAGFSDVRPLIGPYGVWGRPVVSRTEVVGPELGFHRRSCHGPAMVGTDIMPAVIRSRPPRGDIIIRTNQVDGVNGASERVIGIDGPSSIISVNRIAGAVIHVRYAGTAAAVGA